MPGLRTTDNVPIAAIPSALVNGQGLAQIETGFLDVSKAPYNVIPDGITDVSDVLQDAVNDAYNYNLVVWFPKGTYLLSKQLRMRQQAMPGLPRDQRTFAHVLQGDCTGGTRPVLRLQDGASLPADNIFLLFEWWNFDTMQAEPSLHYNAQLRGLTVDAGNNPSAIAVSMPGAQYCAIEDVQIVGQSFAVGIFNLPGSGGSCTNLRIVGGEIGIRQDLYRPNPSVHGLTLEDQRVAGIDLVKTRGPLVLVGFDITSPASPSSDYRAIRAFNTNSWDTSMATLVLVDGRIEVAGVNGIAVDNHDQDLYVQQLYAVADTIITSGARQGPPEVISGSSSRWKRVREYAWASGTNQTPMAVDGTLVTPVTQDREYLRKRLSNASPPGDLLTRHVGWDMDTFPGVPGSDVVDIRDYGATPYDHDDDDALWINSALLDTTTPSHPNFGKAVFIPRGRFHIRSPVEVPAGATLVGAGNNISVIEVSTDWLPAAPVSIFSTADAEGSITLANFAIEGHQPESSQGLTSHKNMTLLHGRTSNMLIRNVQMSRREYWQTGVELDQPIALFTGNAGGRVYNLAMDLSTRNGTGDATPGHRMLKVAGTTHPLWFYQPDVEKTPNGPQAEIRDANDVVWYGLKYEFRRQLLLIANCDRIGIIGGSGNYSLYEQEGDTIIRVVNTTNYIIANLSRRQALDNPRDNDPLPNPVDFAWVIDEGNGSPSHSHE